MRIETEQETPWQQIALGVIYHMQGEFQTGSLDRIELDCAQYRYLRLTIVNNDNPPLDVVSAEVSRTGAWVVFPVESGKSYAIYGGNADAQPPVYDLEKALPKLDAGTLPAVTAGVMQSLKEDEVLPWTERHGWIIGVVLIFLTGVMAVFIVVHFRRIGVQEQQRGDEKEHS